MKNRWFKGLSLFLLIATFIVTASCTTTTETVIETQYYVTEEFPINPVHRYTPAVSGDIVVWVDESEGNKDIYGHDLATDDEFPICTNSYNQAYPVISGDTIIWRDERGGNSDIYSYDLATETGFIVSPEMTG